MPLVLPSAATAAALLSLLGATSAWTTANHATVLKMTAGQTASAPQVVSVPLSISGHDKEAWKKSYSTCPEEVPPIIFPCPDLPNDFPAGTYYRNGHGRFESDDGMRAHHMFDADGLVTAVTFDPSNKQLLFRNRFVRTQGYINDKETGTMSKPGIFGTRVSGGFWKNLFRTDFKNVANTHVLYNKNGKLYALWEGGWPHVLDPLTLENDVEKEPLGHDLNGLLKTGDSFAAHYRVDARSGNIVNFGTTLDPVKGESKITLYEFDDNMEPIRSDDVSFIFKGAAVVHDYALTENWHVFVMPPAGVNQKKALMALLGQAAFAEVIDFDTDATESIVYLVPRMKDLQENTASNMRAGEDDRIKIIKVPYHFNFHFANAFEDDEGNVIVDSVLTEEAELGTGFSKDVPLYEQVDFDDLVPNKYVRFAVSPKTCTLAGTAPQTISTRDNEFPVVPMELSSKKHRFAYTVGGHQAHEPDSRGRGGGAAGAIMKLDTEFPDKSESYSFLPHEFVGESVFCPKVGADVTVTGNEDKAYLVTYVVNGRDLTTDLVIFDVEGRGKLEEGPVVRFRLPTYIPPGLHGTFVEGLTFSTK